MAEGLVVDRARTALVVIDLQKGIASDGSMRPYSSREVVGNAARLVDVFREAGMPVFLVHIELPREIALQPSSDLPPLDPIPTPPGFSDFVPELTPVPSDVVITKRQWGAFQGTELDTQLRRRGVRTIVLCGIATNFGVESTARAAYELGYEQLFAEDAMTASSAEEHQASLKVLRHMGRVRTTDEIASAVE